MEAAGLLVHVRGASRRFGKKVAVLFVLLIQVIIQVRILFLVRLSWMMMVKRHMMVVSFMINRRKLLEPAQQLTLRGIVQV